MLTLEQNIRVCHSKLIIETQALLQTNRNFVDMLLGSHGASVDEAKCKIKGVISGLNYLLEEMEKI